MGNQIRKAVRRFPLAFANRFDGLLRALNIFAGYILRRHLCYRDRADREGQGEHEEFTGRHEHEPSSPIRSPMDEFLVFPHDVGILVTNF